MRATPPNVIVATSAVCKRFPGVLALDSVSLDFRAGEVHAVVGENGAGKSTLMNVLAGELTPDAGEILVDGVATSIRTPLESQSLGIKVVYQELSLCPNLTVAENVMLSDLAERSPFSAMRRSRTREQARTVLARLGMADLAVDQLVGTLTVAQRQMVEIARAISRSVRVLVLDEPNSALSPDESTRLFDVVRQLRAEGTSVIYVSHHLEEVLELADRVSVMRDGRLITTLERSQITIERLIAAMVGRDVDPASQWSVQAAADVTDRPVALEARNLCSVGSRANVSFSLREGEILGIGGLPDSGKDELVDALFGLAPRGGEVILGGAMVRPGSPRQALEHGMALIPGDRRGAGALLSMSVAQNIVSASLRRFSRFGFVRSAAVSRESALQVRRIDVRIASLTQKIRSLSGGNQQKIILIRGLVTEPRVLILHEPTRGIDVGAKAEIYAILRELAARNVAILMVSSELPELVLHCSRVIVLVGGQIAGELEGSAITEEAVLECALVTPSVPTGMREVAA